MVMIAFKKINSLPEILDKPRASKFEKGLNDFVVRMLRRSFNSFKNEIDEGQSMKKRSVIQLINTTMNGQKKMFDRWFRISERSKLMNECKEVSNMFQTLKFTLKSVCDTAFSDNRENVMKEKALMQLFKNMEGNIGTCFKKWRDINNIEREN